LTYNKLERPGITESIKIGIKMNVKIISFEATFKTVLENAVSPNLVFVFAVTATCCVKLRLSLSLSLSLFTFKARLKTHLFSTAFC